MKCIEYKKKNGKKLKWIIERYQRKYKYEENRILAEEIFAISHKDEISAQNQHTHTHTKTQHNLDPVFFKEEHVIV